MLVLRRALPLAVCAFWGSQFPVFGEPPAPRELGFPREGFSVQVPNVAPGFWTVVQPADALLELRRRGGGATIWFRRDAGKGDDLAGRLREMAARLAGEDPAAKPPEPEAWKVAGAGAAARVGLVEGRQQHGFALVTQPRGQRLELEWVHARDDKLLPDAVASLLASLDVTPFENSRRHVDWTDGWSIDVPGGWDRAPDREGRTLFAAREKGGATLAVRRAPSGGTDGALGEELGHLLAARTGKAGQLEIQPGPPPPAGATRRVEASVRLAPPHGPSWRLVGEERSGWWIATIAPTDDPTLSADVAPLAATFRASPEPGPRASIAKADAPTDGFEREEAPKVVFRVPAGWKKGTPSSSMRLAQYQVPGAEPAECAVFFFGAGGGGGLEANIERWKSQFQVEGEPKLTREDVAEGLKATLLDVSGRFVGEMHPGSGEKSDKPGWRLLAAVLETPQGPLFLKLTGPQATLAQAEADFLAWVRSFRRKP